MVLFPSLYPTGAKGLMPSAARKVLLRMRSHHCPCLSPTVSHLIRPRSSGLDSRVASISDRSTRFLGPTAPSGVTQPGVCCECSPPSPSTGRARDREAWREARGENHEHLWSIMRWLQERSNKWLCILRPLSLKPVPEKAAISASHCLCGKEGDKCTQEGQGLGLHPALPACPTEQGPQMPIFIVFLKSFPPHFPSLLPSSSPSLLYFFLPLFSPSLLSLLPSSTQHNITVLVN